MSYFIRTHRDLVKTIVAILVGIGALSMGWAIFPTFAAVGDVGYQDFSLAGSSAPTGQKPQSKLWFNDGLWWGVLFNSKNSRYEIYKMDWAAQTWIETGTVVDTRSRSSADALWNGNNLYIVSNMTPGASGVQNINLVRFSYDPVTKTYSLDAGFPVSLWPNATETVVIDQDSTGMLWVTFTDTNGIGGRSVFVTHSISNDLTWIAPYVIPATGADNLSADDISTLVSYNGNIGVMWSNQETDTVYFASHADGLPDNAWSQNPALQGPKYADDHLNIKSLQADSAGQLFAAVKTSLGDVNPSTSTKPQILLLTLDNNGAWSRREVARIVDNHTRPIVLVDNENRQIYVFMTHQSAGTSGSIYYKQASLDDASMQFEQGLGTPFILFASSKNINNASSTKQTVNSTTNLLVIAGDDTTHLYFHNFLDLSGGKPTSTATITPSPTATVTPTLTLTPTSTATDTATSTATDTATSTATDTATSTATDTATSNATDTATSTATDTATSTATDTATSTATDTSTSTATATATNTATPTPTNTSTVTETATATLTPTNTATNTATITPTMTDTATVTATATSSATLTPSGQDPKIFLPLIMR